MSASALESRLRASVAPGAVHVRAALAEHTTWHVGGPADFLVDARSVDELVNVVTAARENGTPLTILGGGSNVVVSDEGIPGVVVRPRLTAIEMASDSRVRAEAGVTMNGLVRWTIGRGLSSLEAWAGTPGTVGGAIYGNAHYAGVDIGNKVASVRVMDRDGSMREIPRAEMGFGYDTSRLQRTGEILVSADFDVLRGDPEALRAVARASLAHRKRTQPLALPSAGCIFQNPDPARDRLPAGLPASAGALIDRAGLKGARVGGASISSIHANFFVNDGGATARDIWLLAESARAAVREKFGVALRNEVVFLGHF